MAFQKEFGNFYERAHALPPHRQCAPLLGYNPRSCTRENLLAMIRESF